MKLNEKQLVIAKNALKREEDLLKTVQSLKEEAYVIGDDTEYWDQRIQTVEKKIKQIKERISQSEN